MSVDHQSRPAATVGSTSAVDRRVDLDWLRIGAFGLLILYHVGMFYVPWEWHVNSDRPVEALEPVMRFLNPWRLGLLFLVAGCATAYMFRKMGPIKLAASRIARLLPPLLMGVFVIVPPQSYYEVVEKINWSTGPLDFYLRYVSGYSGFCRDGDCLVVPIYNHLWFVAYLLCYVLVAVLLYFVARPVLGALARVLERLLSGVGLIFWPWLILSVWRWLLAPSFPPNNLFIEDWYNHALYFSLFLLGLGMAERERIWLELARFRWLTLSLMLAAYAASSIYLGYYAALDAQPPEWQRVIMRSVFALNQWAAIAAALGWAGVLLRRDGPVRRYLTEAVFPYYIVHQTIIVVVAFHLAKLQLPLGLEAGLLVAATFAGCAATYEAVRRVSWLRPWFGLKPIARDGRPEAARLHEGVAGGRG